jgi:hypothetical protein
MTMGHFYLAGCRTFLNCFDSTSLKNPTSTMLSEGETLEDRGVPLPDRQPLRSLKMNIIHTAGSEFQL